MGFAPQLTRSDACHRPTRPSARAGTAPSQSLSGIPAHVQAALGTLTHDQAHWCRPAHLLDPREPAKQLSSRPQRRFLAPICKPRSFIGIRKMCR